jgi:AhpC/TSA family
MGSMRRIPTLVLVSLFCLSTQAYALQPGDTVDNFRVIDHAGKSHELYYLSDMKAVVLVAYGAECDVAAQAAKSLDALHARHARDVALLLIDSNLRDSREAIAKAASAAGFAAPVLHAEWPGADGYDEARSVLPQASTDLQLPQPHPCAAEAQDSCEYERAH